MTILYYEERKRQILPINILKNKKQPFLSKKISYAIITLLTIIILAGAALTTTIKYKTDILINNAYEYIDQIKQNNSFTPEDIEQFKNMKPQEFVMTILKHETQSNTLDTIEKFVFTFVAYLMIK
jgi:predicted PurR-regulated permease PerM